MREIIFRGKSLVDEAWKYGYYTKIEDNYIRDGDFLNMVKPETVGQYTGLVDKNGVRIFEGDVLKREVYVMMYGTSLDEYVEEHLQVEYREEYAGFYIGERSLCSYVDTTRDIDTGCTCTKVEVVGNVFENAELLEAKQMVTNKYNIGDVVTVELNEDRLFTLSEETFDDIDGQQFRIVGMRSAFGNMDDSHEVMYELATTHLLVHESELKLVKTNEEFEKYLRSIGK